MRRTLLRITRSVKVRISEGEAYCSGCRARLVTRHLDGRIEVEPCRTCSGSFVRTLRVFALLVACFPLIPLHAEYTMHVNGEPAEFNGTWLATGANASFTISGTGASGTGNPACNRSGFYYQYEGGSSVSVSGTTLSLSAQPGTLSVNWGRYCDEDCPPHGGPCEGYGSAGALVRGFNPPTLHSIEIDPPQPKIYQIFNVIPTADVCLVIPGNPDSSDACGGSFNWTVDFPCNRSPCNWVDRIGPVTITATLSNPAGESTKSVTVDFGATEAPSAFFHSPSSPPAGAPVQFTNQTSKGYRSLFWDFGDGTFSTEENPVHTFSAADDHVVTLTATNEIGSDTFTSTLNVQPKSGGSPPGAADFTWTPAKPVTGQNVQFTDKSTGTITRWRWSFDDGSEARIEQSPTHSFHAQDVYNVELWVSNLYGRKGIVLFVPVQSASSPPLADFTFTPADVRVGVPVQFTDTSAGASSWLWDFGENGATSTLQHPTYSYTTPGQKAVKLTVTNAAGTDSHTKFFACHGGDTTQLESRFVFSPADPEVGEQVQFTDLSTGSPESWSWVISDGTQTNQRNFKHSFAAPGQYGVSLRVDKGSQHHISVQVVNVGNATGPVSDFTWSPGTPKPNETVHFTNLSQNATSYTWDFGDGSTSDAVDPTHAFTEQKKYSVKLTAHNGSQSSSITKLVTVSSTAIPPAASFIANPNPASVGSEVRFTDTSTGAPSQWSWDFGYSNQKSTQQHPTHRFPFEGTFLVKLVVTNAAGSSNVTLPVTIRNQILKPAPDFTWSPDPAIATIPVQFSDRSGNAPKGWSWDFGDGATGSGAAPVHAFAAAGNYNVTLRVSNEAGESQLTRVVPVSAPPIQAEFDLEPANPLAGKPVRLLDRSTGDPVAWKWIVDGNVVGTARNLNWTFFTGGEHTVGLEVRGATGNESFRQRGISVLAPPVASFKASSAIVFGSSIAFTDTSSGNPSIRRWYVDDAFAGSAPALHRTFQHTGDAKIRLEVENAAGKDGLTRYYHVSPNSASAPRIRKVQPQFGPCFYSSYPISTPVEVDIDWRTHQSKLVSMELNGVADPPVPGSSPKTLLSLESRRLVFGSTVNNLEVTAIGDGGSPSEPTVVKLLGISVPDWLVGRVARTISEDRRKSWTTGVYLPADAFESKPLRFPKLLGGGEFQITKTQFKLEKILRTDCSVATYAEVTGGIKIGKGFGGIKGNATSEKKLSELDKVVSDEVTLSLEGFGGAEAKLTLDDAVPAVKPLCENAIIDHYICKAIEVKVEGQGSLGGTAAFTVANDGSLTFKETEKYFEVQLTASGAASAGSAKLEVFGGGKGNFKLGNFSDPHLVKKADLTVELGARLTWLGSVYEKKTGWGCTFQYDKDAVCGNNVTNLTAGPQRTWTLRPAALLDRSVPVESESDTPPVMLGNVSALADPSSASDGDRSITLFLSENESSTNPLQRLDVKARRRDAGGSTVTENITSDVHGDFNPVAILDANRRAVAAWERVKNASITHADIGTLDDMPKLLRAMEIAVSTSTAGSPAWTTVELLSSNDVQDQQPALAALDDGRTLLVWIRGSGTEEQQVVSRTLTGAEWSAEQVVASGLRAVNDLALGADGTSATLVISHRGAGEENDLSYLTFEDGWSARQPFTSGAEDDHSPAVAHFHGVPHVYWLRGGALLAKPIAGGDIETARSAVAEPGLTRPIVAVRADGTPVVVWSSGSDVRAILRDSATGRWTTDFTLTDQSRAHSALSAWFTSEGSLHVSSLGTTLERIDVPAVIDGQPVTIEDVAQPGRSDLIEVVTDLEVDLLAIGATFAAEPRRPLDGESVAVFVDVRNAGTIPVRDVTVDLLRGGSLAGTTIVAGDWMPRETKRVQLTFTHREAGGDLLLVVDPANATNDVSPANNRAAFSFANRSPVACFQASAGSGASPLTIALDAGCSIDPDGALARYSWSFGDGTSASGPRVSHTFTTAGTHDVILTVTDSMGASSSRTIAIDVGLAIDHRSSTALHRLYFAVVGRLTGVANTYFVSDLTLVNTDLGAPLTIDAVYLPDGRRDTYRRTITIAPGALLEARDLLAHLFGATNGAGSLRLDLSHAHAVAIARIYNDQPSGTAGLSYAGLSPDSALRDGERAVIPQHWLPGYRTNIGFTEVSGVSSRILVRSFDEQGTARGETSFAVGPFQHIQATHALLQSRGRIEVLVQGGSVIAYASTVDDRTGDPIYQLAERVPASGRTLLVPVVGRLKGANDTSWRSDVRVVNVHTAAQDVTLSLRTPGGTYATTRSAAAGETLAWDDVVTNAFPQLTGDVGGSLLVTADAPVLATSRTFNLTPDGTYGLYVPARATHELVSEGESAWLVQLRETDTYRCNLGIASHDAPVVVSVRAFDAFGTTLAVKQYSVAAGQNRQVGRVFADMGVPLPLEAAGIEVTVLQGTALIYASVIDNRTGDSTYVEAR